MKATDPKEEESLLWPEKPAGIAIMGKRQGNRPENRQLQGRIAMGAALWHSAPEPKPYLAFVAADVHGPARIPDTETVKNLLIREYEVPPDYLILRKHSNCTVVEVRAIRVLSRVYDFSHVFALTHLYHAPRTQLYFNEVLPNATVIPVHTDVLDEVSFPVHYLDMLPPLRERITASQPFWLDHIREQMVEWGIGLTHRLDPRGRFERMVAQWVRPETAARY